MSEEKNIPIWQHDGHTVVEEVRPALRKPPMFQVILLNDDYTPMEFVNFMINKFQSIGIRAVEFKRLSKD